MLARLRLSALCYCASQLPFLLVCATTNTAQYRQVYAVYGNSWGTCCLRCLVKQTILGSVHLLAHPCRRCKVPHHVGKLTCMLCSPFPLWREHSLQACGPAYHQQSLYKQQTKAVTRMQNWLVVTWLPAEAQCWCMAFGINHSRSCATRAADLVNCGGTDRQCTMSCLTVTRY